MCPPIILSAHLAMYQFSPSVQQSVPSGALNTFEFGSNAHVWGVGTTFKSDGGPPATHQVLPSVQHGNPPGVLNILAWGS